MQSVSLKKPLFASWPCCFPIKILMISGQFAYKPVDNSQKLFMKPRQIANELLPNW